VYNIPVLDRTKGEILVLDRTTLAYIFIGNISVWNDARILDLQSSEIRAKLEAAGNQPIQIIVRNDGSGSTEVMTKSLDL
jgi:ABC-type phosphate transport system substrate-binding protein